MLGRAALSIACAVVLFASGAAAENRNDLAPYRFRTPGDSVSPVDRGSATIYRNQLQQQQFQLDREEAAGRLSPMERREKLDNETELNRMNRTVGPQPRTQFRAPSARSLPSLPQPIIPRSSP
jgi:hypothetical protein